MARKALTTKESSHKKRERVVRKEQRDRDRSIENLSTDFAGMNFEQLNSADKDKLMKTMAIKLGILIPS